MRIGLDAHILGKGKGGVERVVHQMVRLLPELLPEDEFIVLTKRGYEPTFGSRPNVRYLRLPISDPLIQRSLLLPLIARRERLDLLHVQRVAPPRVRTRLVVHTHDLLPLTAPEDHTGLRDRLVRALTASSLLRADAVLTVSEAVATEIRTLFPKVAHKLTAIYNGIEGGLFRPASPGAPRAEVHRRLGLKEEYVLYVGAMMARKNLEVAVRGHGAFLARCATENRPRNCKLVLAGMSRSEAYVKRLHALADEVAPGSVCFAGFVSDTDCVALMQHAAAFLAPSKGEGFDLPALEAMACASPVICSDLPVHRELLGKDALYFSADHFLALADRLWQLAEQKGLRFDLSQRGPVCAAQYTWEIAMRRLADLYANLKPQPLVYSGAT